MIKPTEYKSLTYDEIKARKGTAVSADIKQKAQETLSKFVALFKHKHL